MVLNPASCSISVWFLVGNGGMDYGDYGDYIGPTIGIHSPIPYEAPDSSMVIITSLEVPGGN